MQILHVLCGINCLIIKEYICSSNCRGEGAKVVVDIHMDARLAKRIQSKKKELDAFRPLSPEIVKRLYEDLKVRFTYHSNAIEGSTLSLAETRLIIEENLSVEGHTITELLEARNHGEAYDLLQRMAQKDITLETVLKLHAVLMEKLLAKPGELRDGMVYIRGSNYTPPPARDVSGYLLQWIHWLASREAAAYEPVTRAAIAHHAFESIHPFFDGNGRVGRLLLAVMLMQDGYPPALILKEWRVRYILALQAGHRGDLNQIVNVVGNAVEYSLDLYLEACQEGTMDLVPLKELSKVYDLDSNYLGQLARQGKLEATKRGALWYSKREMVERYLHEAAQEKRGRRRER